MSAEPGCPNCGNGNFPNMPEEPCDECAEMDRRERLILEAHGEHCGCSSCAWKKILDEVTGKGNA